MRRTIRGSRYDTETATLRGERTCVVGDAWYVESLYETPRGKWFLYGAGGPDSPWARWGPSGLRTDGEAIRPLPEESAGVWLGRHGGLTRRVR